MTNTLPKDIQPSDAKPTKAQLRALAWLADNGGLEVPNMNMHGRSKEWPNTKTLRCLVRDGLADFEQRPETWRVTVSDAGRAITTTKTGRA